MGVQKNYTCCEKTQIAPVTLRIPECESYKEDLQSPRVKREVDEEGEMLTRYYSH